MRKKFYTYVDYTNDGIPFYAGKGDSNRVETRAKITAAQIGRIMRNETACRKVMADIYLIAQRITNGESRVSIQEEYGVSKSFLYRQLKKLADEKGV